MIGWPSSGRCLRSSTQVDRDTRSVNTPTTTLPEATCGSYAAQSAEENAALHQNQTRSPSRTESGCGKEQSPDRVSCVRSTYLQAPGSPTRCTYPAPRCGGPVIMAATGVRLQPLGKRWRRLNRRGPVASPELPPVSLQHPALAPTRPLACIAVEAAGVRRTSHGGRSV
jgi:hypothetical protein